MNVLGHVVLLGGRAVPVDRFWQRDQGTSRGTKHGLRNAGEKMRIIRNMCGDRIKD